MNYSIEKSGGKPAYLQLYELLRGDIVAGIYPFLSRLPSKRTIAAETGVSVITVEHALSLLCDEGYTEARERSGCYVIYRKGDFQSTQKTLSVSPKPIPASAMPRGLFPYSVLARTMRRVLLDYGERILERSPNRGCDELREAIRAYLARSRAVQVEPEQIIIGSGAEYLYGLIAQLLGRNRPFALEDPSYGKIRSVYEAYGITCRMLPMDIYGISPAALHDTDAGVLHVTPFNSYPSGATADVSRKYEYLRWSAQRGGCIIEDNYDSELTVSRKAEDTLFSMSDGHGVIYINTFSQTVSPSLRAGYMLLPTELLNDFEARLGFYSCTVPLFDQFVLAELLRSGDFERHVNRVRRAKRRSGNT